MILSSDCDYYGEERDTEFAPQNECESCYRFDMCIRYKTKVNSPISVEDLPKHIGKSLWIQPPNTPDYGRVAVVEGVDVDNRILYLVDDYTCHEYGTVWEAYDINEGVD